MPALRRKGGVDSAPKNSIIKDRAGGGGEGNRTPVLIVPHCGFTSRTPITPPKGGEGVSDM